MGDESTAARVRGGDRRAVVLGFALWAAFCCMAVLLRGVRWDENYEFAQVVLRQVVHPPGHPHVVYVTNAYSVQVYLSAALLWLTHNAWLVCAVRNLLFVLGTVLPVYLLAALLARRAIWGHVAACLVLFAVHAEFDSTYPQFIWPGMFSNGHIGMAYALVTVYFLILGRLRTAFLLLGLMPCIHLGHLPPVCLLAGLIALDHWRRDRTAEVLRALVPLTAGILCCVAFWLVQRSFVEPLAASGAYAAATDPMPVWRAIVARHDVHRAIPTGNCHVALVSLLLVAAVMAWRERGTRGGFRPWCWVLAYTIGLAAVVWGTMAVHAAMGAATPPILLRWMPYRLLNHVPLLLIASLCGVLAGNGEKGARPQAYVLAAALLWCLIHPLLEPLVGASVHARYVVPSAGLLFALLGAAWGASFGSREVRRVLTALVPAAAGIALFHQFGAACFAGGFLATVLVNRCVLERAAWPAWAAAVLCFTAALVVLRQEAAGRVTLPVSPFDSDVSAYFAEQDEGTVMLVGPPHQLLLQAKTGQAVMSDMALSYLPSYLPAIAPVVDQVFRDVYGVYLGPVPEAAAETAALGWQEHWRRRGRERWCKLAAAYAFQFVVAPDDVPLDLPPAVRGDGATLYQIAASP